MIWFKKRSPRVDPETLEKLRALARAGPLTLVYGAHDEAHNDAVALRQFLLGHWSAAASA